MEIRYCMLTAAFDHEESRHPQEVLRSLGIEWDEAIPQSLFDCWIFKGCINVPDNIPSYLKPRTNKR